MVHRTASFEQYSQKVIFLVILTEASDRLDDVTRYGNFKARDNVYSICMLELFSSLKTFFYLLRLFIEDL